MRTYRSIYTLASVLALALCGCATVQTTRPGAVGVERKQTMLVSEESVEQGAQKAYLGEVEQAKASGKLNADPALTARIKRITDRLIPATGKVASVTFGLPHDRQQEAEADVMGLELMARAGYDPHEAISLWRKMMAAEKSAPPQFLSTHPASANRIAELQSHMPQVVPLYLAAAPKGSSPL